MNIDKRILNYIVIIFLTLVSFYWTFWIFHKDVLPEVVISVIIIRLLASTLIFRDYTISWSKSTQKTFLIKSIVYIGAFIIYMPLFYGQVRIALFVSELFLYLFMVNFLMYSYYYFINKSNIVKTKRVVIYGAGQAGLKIAEEFRNSEYKISYFIDDDKKLQHRSIDSIKIISPQELEDSVVYDLLIIAIPSAKQSTINDIYERLNNKFATIQILPSLNEMLRDKDFSPQLKNISVEDLLARHPADLDKDTISSFTKDKKVLITGAGGSIGSELVRQVILFGASQIILLDHSEFNLYQIEQEVNENNILNIVPIMQSVVNIKDLEKTFKKYSPDIVIHAAAYKHVPLVEANIDEAIKNNIIGTKNIIDVSIANGVEKLVLISTDKAVRPTNVMGATKRICELYAQNVVSLNSNKLNTNIVAVRFGNVLGSSGSVIPKFKSQIEKGVNITVTHPDITRYFMLIPEACELVLQAGAIGAGGEIFILDMGEPIRIVDLANKMIKLSGKSDIEIKFSGLRPGEKLYEELLIDDTDCTTKYQSITVAHPTQYAIDKLNSDIKQLLSCEDKIKQLKKIVPEFNHQPN